MGDSKGRKLWGIVRIANDFRWVLGWLLGLPWGAKVVAVVTPLLLLWFSIIKSFRWPVLMFFGLCAFFLLYLFFTALFKVEISSEASPPLPTVEKELSLLLTPHGDNSPLLCLEVKNKGEDVKLTATIRVVSRSYGGPFDTRPYTGRWTLLNHRRRFGDHRPEPTAPVVTISAGDYRILEIAKQDPDNGKGNDTSAAYLVGFDEFLRWDFEQKPDSKLPSFRLQIEFRADGVPKSLSKLYDVGPKHAYGPLHMIEVTTA
jgi:hypothetical protein